MPAKAAPFALPNLPRERSTKITACTFLTEPGTNPQQPARTYFDPPIACDTFCSRQGRDRRHSLNSEPICSGSWAKSRLSAASFPGTGETIPCHTCLESFLPAPRFSVGLRNSSCPGGKLPETPKCCFHCGRDTGGQAGSAARQPGGTGGHRGSAPCLPTPPPSGQQRPALSPATPVTWARCPEASSSVRLGTAPPHRAGPPSTAPPLPGPRRRQGAAVGRQPPTSWGRAGTPGTAGPGAGSSSCVPPPEAFPAFVTVYIFL